MDFVSAAFIECFLNDSIRQIIPSRIRLAVIQNGSICVHPYDVHFLVIFLEHAVQVLFTS